MQERSGFVDSHATDRSATDAHEVIASTQAGTLRWASPDDINDQQPVGGRLELEQEFLRETCLSQTGYRCSG